MRQRPSTSHSSLAGATLAFALSVLANAFASDVPTTAPRGGALRLGFTASVFEGINTADARASVRALTRAIAGEYEVRTDPDPVVANGLDEAAAALGRSTIDALGITIEEYSVLRSQVKLGRLVSPVDEGDPAEVYVLVVRGDRDLKSLSDLAGKRLVILSGMRMDLGEIWLDVELAHAGRVDTGRFFGAQTQTSKPAKALLPVFFGQADACLVNRRALETAIELNPQLGRALLIVASSPSYVPSVMAFKADDPDERVQRWISIVTTLHGTPAGLQALTIFHSRQVAEVHVEDLAPALALIAEHARLWPEIAAARLTAMYTPSRKGDGTR